MHRTENAELTGLCLIEDGNTILHQNRVKKTGEAMHCRAVMKNSENQLWRQMSF
jgi:hypothetical protein